MGIIVSGTKLGAVGAGEPGKKVIAAGGLANVVQFEPGDDISAFQTGGLEPDVFCQFVRQTLRKRRPCGAPGTKAKRLRGLIDRQHLSFAAFGPIEPGDRDEPIDHLVGERKLQRVAVNGVQRLAAVIGNQPELVANLNRYGVRFGRVLGEKDQAVGHDNVLLHTAIRRP
jgi:hypothetical protein